MDGASARDLPAGVRYHYMDNLRAVAMMAGVFFHAALAYSPLMHELWLTADPQRSTVMDVLAWFSHLFRMPLFFTIAGFFGAYLIAKRGVAGLLRNRSLRILIPFVLFLPLVWVSFLAAIQWAMQNVEHPSPILAFVIQTAKDPQAAPPPPTTSHLWFLYNLIWFYLVFVALHRSGALATRWASYLRTSRFLIFGLPLVLIAALWTQPAPHPAPEQFVPQIWSFGFFGVFFLIGTQLFKDPSVLDRLRPYALVMSVSSAVAYAAIFLSLPSTIRLEDAIAVQKSGIVPHAPLWVAALEALVAAHMTLVSLAAGKAFFDQSNRGLRLIADSSYWVYLIHLPVLFFVQFALLDVDWGLGTEFAVSSFGTIAIGLASYLLFVRWTPIGWLLNGRRRPTPR